MGGAQPLAITLNGGVAICIEVDSDRIARRIEHRYLDVQADDLDHALRIASQARAEKKAISIGVLGNAAEILPSLVQRDFQVDVVTDQTPAHDPLSYVPSGLSPEDAAELRLDEPDAYVRRARESMAMHVDAMVAFLDRGAEVFDYGNSLRAEARLGGSTRAFDFPGFVPAYIRPLFCRGVGPFRWAALSGDEGDIAVIDDALKELFPDDVALQRWLELAPERVAFQGIRREYIPLRHGQRACLVCHGETLKLIRKITDESHGSTMQKMIVRALVPV